MRPSPRPGTTLRACTPTSTIPLDPLTTSSASTPPTFIPTFVAARLPGWPVHIAEQLTANSLIRLLAAYSGTAERHLS